MKKTTYFGNRFKTALGGFRKRASRVSVTRESGASSEFEALENRILLSGITDGTKVLRNITFTDADGDRVNIKVVGGPRNSGFQVPGLGNGFDVDEINLVGLTTASNLVITVTPVRLSATSVNTTGGSLWSPGYTNIGSIVADDQTNNTGKAVVGANGLRNLALNAAIVGDIDIPDVNIQGSLTLGVGKTAFLDRINTASAATDGANAKGYNPVAGLIDLNDVTAASIGRITVNGIVSSPVDPNGVLTPPLTDTNDLNGTIIVGGDLGGITAVRSILNSNITVGDDLGPINVGIYKANLAIGGDVTINLPAGSGGTIVAGGHVNLGFQSSTTGAAVTTNVTAGAGISGIAPALDDAIIVPSSFNNTLINTSTAATKGSGIADIIVSGGAGNFTVQSANSVGDLTATSFAGGMNVTAGNGGIGDLTATAGGLGGTYTSGGTVGNVSVTGGALSGNITAAGNVGNIAINTAATAGLTGAIISTAGNIGNVLANITGPTGGAALSGGLQADGTIGTITLTSLSQAANTVTGLVAAGDGIGAILVTAATSGDAVNGATFNANTDNDNTGAIPSITVTNSGTGGDGIVGAAFAGTSIGNITAKITGVNGGDAIRTSTFATNDIVETFVGSGVFNNFGKIADIIVVNSTTNGNGGGILGSTFTAGSAGSIGNISVQIPNANGLGTGNAISGTLFAATNGAPNQTKFTSTVGTLTVLSTTLGDAVLNTSVLANNGTGAVNITAQATGANNLNINADQNADGTGNAAATTVTITGINGSGILGGSIVGANVGDITVTFPNSTTLGSTSGAGISGLAVQALTGTNGNIGNITVGALANPAGGAGITGLTAAADGNIGTVTAFANTGVGIGGGTTLASDFDGSKAGDVGNIAGTSVGADGIGITIVTGVNVGTITGTVTGTTGDDGIDGLVVTTFNGGNVGNITATTAGIGAAAHGIVSTSVAADGGIGDISATTSQTVGSLGGDGINTSTFVASTGNIGTITATAGGDGVDTGTFVAVKGNIGNINVNGAGIGYNSGAVSAGGTIGTITATGATVAITGASFGAGTAIGATTATGDISASFGTLDPAASTIGNITGTGTGNQLVTISTGAAGGVIGNLDFSKLNNGSTLTLGISNAVTLGSVTVASPGGSADLGLTGGAALTSIGAVAVDGKVTLANSLTSVTALTSLSAGSFAVPGAQIVIGNSAAVGTTVGAISIGADQANIGVIGAGNPAGAAYRFNFDSYTATPDATVVAQNITAVAAGAFAANNNAAGNSTAGGFAFILA